MFFDDPVAAFANIAVALRPAGRLVMMVWQAHERNEWSVAIERALGRLREALAAHAGERGVWFDSRAWIIEGRR
jgi:SAM-dependent methyltransferase